MFRDIQTGIFLRMGSINFLTAIASISFFVFDFLAFWFAWSIRIMPSRFRLIKSGMELSKITGYSTFEKIKVSAQFIFLAVCWWYLIQAIIANYHLYQGWTIIGLICFMLFVILSTLTLIGSIIVPMNLTQPNLQKS